VVGSCKYVDEHVGSGTMELVNMVMKLWVLAPS
jgi:hypothetical protein